MIWAFLFCIVNAIEFSPDMSPEQYMGSMGNPISYIANNEISPGIIDDNYQQSTIIVLENQDQKMPSYTAYLYPNFDPIEEPKPQIWGIEMYQQEVEIQDYNHNQTLYEPELPVMSEIPKLLQQVKAATTHQKPLIIPELENQKISQPPPQTQQIHKMKVKSTPPKAKIQKQDDKQDDDLQKIIFHQDNQQIHNEEVKRGIFQQLIGRNLDNSNLVLHVLKAFFIFLFVIFVCLLLYVTMQRSYQERKFSNQMLPFKQK